MAMFSGDIPGCLMRMPGTPASAAYTNGAYAMAKRGQTEPALGAGFVFPARPLHRAFGPIVAPQRVDPFARGGLKS
jgi:hypothetical protein